ncbi:hypothetical protein CAEBREN_22594 [Caenorhabditis brenneri]|uniref:Hsr-9 Tudor domain-containing protein n=1 Tax=Caenorhabditis brenneri TaxID=135651 RepID=G0P8M3_CAEBE|nr:hypothetical protein CAEBREN_22594 [Caenorhabditis brenneri]
MQIMVIQPLIKRGSFCCDTIRDPEINRKRRRSRKISQEPSGEPDDAVQEEEDGEEAHEETAPKKATRTPRGRKSTAKVEPEGEDQDDVSVEDAQDQATTSSRRSARAKAPPKASPAVENKRTSARGKKRVSKKVSVKLSAKRGRGATKKTPSSSNKKDDYDPYDIVIIARPVLNDEKQLQADHPQDENEPHSIGARVYANFQKTFYPAIIIEDRDGLGRYKVQFTNDKLVKDVPNSGIIPLRDLVSGKAAFYDEKDARLDAGPNDIKLLKGKTIYIHSTHAAREVTQTGPEDTFIGIWKPILELLGATVIEGDYDKVIGNGAKFDVALVDGTFRDEVLSYADDIGASKVTSEWVIQTMILGEAPEPTAHPKFDPYKLEYRYRSD